MASPLYRNDRPGQLPKSWYVASTDVPPERPPLYGHTTADVCIVGAGFTGLSAARHLAAKGLEVVVLDAHRVGFGASGRNGGQVCSGYNMPQRALAAKYGADHAARLWDLTEEAKDDIRKLCLAEVPEANYRPGLAEAATRPGEVADMHRDAAYLQETYSYDKISTLDRNAIRDVIQTDDYHGGHIDMGAGHIHPLRLVLGIAQLAERAGARIFERAEVHHIAHGDPAEIRTDKGRVKANHVILAGNGYLPNIERKVTAKILPVNSFIAATGPLGDLAAKVLARDIAVSDSKFVLNYYRMSEDKRLLFGGRPSYEIAFPKDIGTLLHERMIAMFPQLDGTTIDYAWGGTLGITTTRLPAVQRIAPNVVSASGFSGHGVALSGLTGKVMAEAIAGQAGRFDTLSMLKVPSFPGGPALRAPILRLAMTWYAMRDRLGL
ncbi:NAD(P)/FAD-dependent oxidoreductase [Loktanella sp. Alg231-35]|uniref:NAD(P)/FAD-dependent oxidoreductase n=1 Tax=Loktanella sp. Alg231-35 TaxID=1922220 RepID=UPI000D55FFB2|nr:FAD-binding oxidoreductase [Loktanella sp. Alg231-35]